MSREAHTVTQWAPSRTMNTAMRCVLAQVAVLLCVCPALPTSAAADSTALTSPTFTTDYISTTPYKKYQKDASPPGSCGMTSRVMEVPCGRRQTISSPGYPDYAELPLRSGSCQAFWLFKTSADCELLLTVDNENFTVNAGLSVSERRNGQNVHVSSSGSCVGSGGENCTAVKVPSYSPLSKGSQLFVAAYNIVEKFRFQAIVSANAPDDSLKGISESVGAKNKCECDDQLIKLHPDGSFHYTTPNYPSDYQNGCNCFTPIFAPPGYYVSLDPVSLDLEDGQDFLLFYACDKSMDREFLNDSTTIFTLKAWATGKIVSAESGEVSKVVGLGSNCGAVRLVSDYRTTRPGAKVPLRLTKTACAEEPCGAVGANCTLVDEHFLCQCPSPLRSQGLDRPCARKEDGTPVWATALLGIAGVLLFCLLVVILILGGHLYLRFNTPNDTLRPRRQRPPGRAEIEVVSAGPMVGPSGPAPSIPRASSALSQSRAAVHMDAAAASTAFRSDAHQYEEPSVTPAAARPPRPKPKPKPKPMLPPTHSPQSGNDATESMPEDDRFNDFDDE